MTSIFVVAFFVLVFFFTGKVVAEVKEDTPSSFGFKNNAKKYFAAERKYLKNFIIFAVIDIIAILILRKFVAVFALGIIFVFGLFILFKLYKNSEENIKGKTERLAVLIYSLEKLTIVYTIVILITKILI